MYNSKSTVNHAITEIYWKISIQSVYICAMLAVKEKKKTGGLFL